MRALVDIDIRLIRIFLSVVENNGFSAAQSELGMTTSSISSHISTLESRLGSRLCFRGRSGFSLTAEGQVVHQAAQELYQSFSQFQTQVDSLRGSLAGTLRLGLLDTALTNANAPLLSAIARYNQRLNSTRISIYESEVDALEHQVLAGQLDLALAGSPHRIDGLRYLHLYDELQGLYCAFNHPLFEKPDAEINVDLLRQQRVVSRETWAAIEADKFLGKRADAFINHIQTKVQTILTGSYIGFLPVSLADPMVTSKLLRSIRPTDFNWATSYYLIIKKGVPPSRPLRVFLSDLSSFVKMEIHP